MPNFLRRLLPLALLAGLAGPEVSAAQVGELDPLVPDSVLVAPGFPRIVRLPAPTPGLVSFRLAIPLNERPAEAGAGRMLEALALRRITGAAASLGADVESGRTPWGLVYTVTGPLADLDHLAFVLREAARAPSTNAGTIATVRRELEEGLRRLEETGGGRVEEALRQQGSPEPPIEGTRGAMGSMRGGMLMDLWARTHRADSMTLLVAGDVADPVLLATLSGLGAGRDVASPPPPQGPLPPSPGPGALQTLRRWHGIAWSTEAVLDPRAAVAAAILGARLREGRTDFEAQVRLWETPDLTLIAAVGAAYGGDAAELARRLDGLLTATAESLRPGEVEEVARRLRQDLILQARTPWGRVHLVGRFLDADQDPTAAARYLVALESMGEAELRSFLTDLAAGAPVRAEAR